MVNLIFLVKVYVGTKSPIGTEQTFSFGVKPEDLFRVSYKDIGGGNSKVDGVKECLVVPLDLPLFEWNIENFSCVIKISIEEIDGTETQRTLSQTTAEFAGNFELNPVKGVFEKVGLKFGASAKKTITTTFEKTLHWVMMNWGMLLLIFMILLFFLVIGLNMQDVEIRHIQFH